MRKNKKNQNYKGFYELLKESVNSTQEGVYGEIIKHAPDFFKLLCDILVDKQADCKVKLLTNAALAYLVVPHDIIPEDEHGPLGYVEDVFLCAYVLRKLKNNVSEALLVNNWGYKSDILSLVDEVYANSRRVIGTNCNKVLEFVGLKDVNNAEIATKILLKKNSTI